MSTPRQLALKAKSTKLRTEFFPDVTDSQLWDRKTKNGFATIPRALPMIMILIDTLSPKKPVSFAYLALWCRAWDNPLVTIGPKLHEIALEAGFSGQRAQSSLIPRLEILERLGFVKFAPGHVGKYNHALILNPYLVLKNHKETLGTQNWNILTERMSDIGANDFDPPPPPIDLTGLLEKANLTVQPPVNPAIVPAPLSTKPPPPRKGPPQFNPTRKLPGNPSPRKRK